jgi:sec-independent protein translocase protein TatC
MQNEGEMGVLEHLRELRRRIIVSLLFLLVAAAAAYVFYRRIYLFFLAPFANLPPLSFPGVEKLFVGSLLEGFSTRLRLSIVAGIVLSSPVHLYNLIAFVFPGLRPREKRVFLVSLIVSLVLVVGAVYYSYYEIIPLVIRFLSGELFVPREVGLLLDYQRNFFYLLQFMLISLAVFQLPLLLEIAMIFGLLKRRRLLRASRYVIVGIFAMAAVLTPPDFVSQLAIALPLILLYFLTIGIAKLFSFGE